MTGRPRSVSDDAIFEAVATVVTEVGPAGLTLAAVARRVGVSAPALTQRFGSKQGLLVAFAAREAAGVADVLAAARAARSDPLAALRAALVALPGRIASREGLANNLAFLQMDLTEPALREHAVTQSRALRAGLATLLSEAVTTGQLGPDVSPATLADDLYATYSGAMVTWAIDGTGDLAGWLGDHLDRILAPHRTAPRS